MAEATPVVTTEWVLKHLADPSIVVVEVNTDLDSAYHLGHVPGARGWDLHVDLEDQVRRDIPSVVQIEELLSRSGIGNCTTIVLYGDGNNRSATWAFWVLKLYRHDDVRIMDGGRKKWLIDGLPLSKLRPSPAVQVYKAKAPDSSLRATKDHVLSRLGTSILRTIDVRTLEEFTGTHPSAPDTGQAGIYRFGRIPGAVHIPWDDSASSDGSFRPAEELRLLYDDKGVGSSHDVITYCRLGVRASYSWFVLKYLLGFDRVRNYDGSWTEWGNSSGTPIEIGPTFRE